MGGKSGLQKCFLQAPENEDKIMICQFFKFSTLEHFWGFKWIAWVDIRVVLLFYLFQGVRVDLGGELEKLTKYTQIWKYSKFMLLDFHSLYQWENSSPPLCVIHIWKRPGSLSLGLRWIGLLILKSQTYCALKRNADFW